MRRFRILKADLRAIVKLRNAVMIAPRHREWFGVQDAVARWERRLAALVAREEGRRPAARRKGAR